MALQRSGHEKHRPVEDGKVSSPVPCARETVPTTSQWGVPGGWNEYVSRLLTWCSGTVITPEQTLEIASRQAGRSWELNAEALARLG